MSQEKERMEKTSMTLHCPLWDVGVKISILGNLSETCKLSEKDAAKFCPYFAASCGEEELGNTGCHMGQGNEEEVHC